MSELENDILEAICIVIDSSPVIHRAQRNKETENFDIENIPSQKYSNHSIGTIFNKIDTYQLFNEEDISKFDNEIRQLKYTHHKNFQSTIQKLTISTNNFLIGHKYRHDIYETLIPFVITILSFLTGIFTALILNREHFLSCFNHLATIEILDCLISLFTKKSPVIVGSVIVMLALYSNFWIKSGFAYTLTVANLRRILIERINTL